MTESPVAGRSSVDIDAGVNAGVDCDQNKCLWSLDGQYYCMHRFDLVRKKYCELIWILWVWEHAGGLDQDNCNSMAMTKELLSKDHVYEKWKYTVLKYQHHVQVNWVIIVSLYWYHGVIKNMCLFRLV